MIKINGSSEIVKIEIFDENENIIGGAELRMDKTTQVNDLINMLAPFYRNGFKKEDQTQKEINYLPAPLVVNEEAPEDQSSQPLKEQKEEEEILINQKGKES